MCPIILHYDQITPIFWGQKHLQNLNNMTKEMEMIKQIGLKPFPTRS